MPTAQHRLVHEDLWDLPDDGNRYELIDGELFVTPAPRVQHQAVVGFLYVVLREHVHATGGRVYLAPTDIRFRHDTVLEPDLLALHQARLEQRHDRWIDAPPDLVIEVSSPSTASHDLIRKRRVYEQHGVPEYWYVDLDAQRVFVHVLDDATYGDPTSYAAGQEVSSRVFDGLTVAVDDVLAAD